MHGLINRSIQCFLRDTYGPEIWAQVAMSADLEFDSFEALLIYEADLTEAVLDAAGRLLDKPREVLLEDLGTLSLCFVAERVLTGGIPWDPWWRTPQRSVGPVCQTH